MDFYDFLFGKSRRSEHIKDMARRTVEILDVESIGPTELAIRLGIGFKPTKSRKPKTAFYKVVRPLKAVGIIALKRGKDGKVFYALTPDAFRHELNLWYKQVKKG